MNSVQSKLKSQRDQLVSWLTEHAYPLWATHGVDSSNGGFVEVLNQSGHAQEKFRRARVQPRQIYSFAMSPQFGWNGDYQSIVRRGMGYFVKHYSREDGLFRTLCDVNGNPLDHRAYLYDQAFALLSFALAAQSLDARAEFEPQALRVRDAIYQHLKTAEKGFVSSNFHSDTRESNPHMHLLEACIEWSKVGNDAAWVEWAEQITELAMERFIQPNGALKEFFTENWAPAPGTPGRIVEPGHQFEWAWLLLQCNRKDEVSRRAAALKLIDIGETHGVRNGVAINSLLDDFSIHDANARCWCQTERIKAAVLAANITGEDKYRIMATAAIDGLLRYLNTPVKGLWLDIQQPDGTLIDAVSPASSFYHIIAAIAQVDDGVRLSS